MVRIAGERVADLFAQAEQEALHGPSELPKRYVALARRVGMRHNVRPLPEHRELYCRSCSTFWVEGRTVRTRIRSGRRVRTCLSCGRERRTILRPRRSPSEAPAGSDPLRGTLEGMPVEADAPDEERDLGDGSEDE